MQNDRLPGPISFDFGRILDPKTPPEIVQNRSKIAQNRTSGPLGPKTRTSKAPGSQFERFWLDPGTILDDFGPISGRFWNIWEKILAS